MKIVLCALESCPHKEYSCYDFPAYSVPAYLMYSDVAWVLVSWGTQVQLQITLDPDYLLDYLSVSHDYVPSFCKLFFI